MASISARIQNKNGRTFFSGHIVEYIVLFPHELWHPLFELSSQCKMFQILFPSDSKENESFTLVMQQKRLEHLPWLTAILARLIYERSHTTESPCSETQKYLKFISFIIMIYKSIHQKPLCMRRIVCDLKLLFKFYLTRPLTCSINFLVKGGKWLDNTSFSSFIVHHCFITS